MCSMCSIASALIKKVEANAVFLSLSLEFCASSECAYVDKESAREAPPENRVVYVNSMY